MSALLRPMRAFIPGLLGLLLFLWIPRAAFAANDSGARESTAVLERLLTEADAQLAAGETQLAESRLRSALQEGWLISGTVAAVEGRLEDARAAFEGASRSAADQTNALAALAYVELEGGDPAKAVPLLRQIVSRNPSSGGLRRMLAQALVADGHADQAVQELEEVVAAVPGDLETTFALASGYLQLDKVEEAERLFGRIAEARPIPQTQVLIGRTYRDARRPGRARDALEQALRIDPEVRRARYYLGTVELLEKGADGLDGAVRWFRAELERFPDDPMASLYLGMALAEQRRFEEALPLLEKAAEWPPTRLDALRFLGRGHLALGRAEKATELLEQALGLAEDRGARPRQLAFILYQLGSAARRLGDEEEAESYFSRSQELSKELVEADRDRLEAFVTEADAGLERLPWQTPPPPEFQRISRLTPEARAELRQAVESGLVRAYFDLGVLAARGERFERAVEHFQEAESVDPAFPRLAYSLGMAAFRARRFGVAAESLSRALEKAPGDESLKRTLALAWLNLEAYGRAADLLQDDPLRNHDPSLGYSYALALVRSERLEEAQKAFQGLLVEHPDWPPLYVLLGQAHARQGAWDKAMEALDRALALDPGVAEAQLTRGNILFKQGKLEEAEEALRAEVRARPGDVAARYLLAVVLDLGQQPDEAVGHLERVLAARPGHADGRYLLGKIHLAQGRAEDALLHLEAAADLAPADANVSYQLALAYQRLGRVEMASSEFERYRQLKRPPQGDQAP